MSLKPPMLTKLCLFLLITLTGCYSLALALTKHSISFQIAAYQSKKQAQSYKKNIAASVSLPLYIHPKKINNTMFYELMAGPFEEGLPASNAQKRLKTHGFAAIAKTQRVAVKQPLERDFIPHVIVDQSMRGQSIPRSHKPKSQNFAPQAQSIPKLPNRPKQLWNLRKVDIRAVIEEISKETGKNFIIDPRVQGKISIVSSRAVSIHTAYQMFLSALNILGYSAVPDGKSIKIVPSVDAKQSAIALASDQMPGEGNEPMVRVIGVHNVSAEELVPLLRPLLPQWASLVAYAPSNVLIIAANANNISRLIKIVHRVDVTNNTNISVMPLHYAIAQDLVKAINSLSKNNQASTQAAIAAEPQSNAILISGTKNQRLKMRVLISELDTSNAGGHKGNTQVIHLYYAKAKSIVPVLAGVAKSFGNPVGTVIGTLSDTSQYSSDPSSSDASSAYGNGIDSDTNSQSNDSLPTQTEKLSTTQSSGKAGLPKVEIIGDPNTNSIIVNAPLTIMRTMKAVISQLDKRPAQVLVEAMIAEVDANDAARLGIQWGTLNSTNAVGGNTTSSDDGTTSLFQKGIGIITDEGFSDIQGVLTALENTQNADILSTPSVVVLNNHEAKIIVGQQISVLDSNYPNNANGTTTATPYNTFKQENVALHLYVTPTISLNNSVQLAINQGNDTLQNPEDPTTTPIINISNIDTSVLVKSGDTLVLGGLIQNQDDSGVNNGLPVLSKIPLIGYLFGEHSHGTRKKMLMVFIRPIILRNPKDSYDVTGENYNNLRNQQLSWDRNQPLHRVLNNAVLKPWGKPVSLPTPFGLPKY